MRNHKNTWCLKFISNAPIFPSFSSIIDYLIHSRVLCGRGNARLRKRRMEDALKIRIRNIWSECMAYKELEGNNSFETTSTPVHMSFGSMHIKTSALPNFCRVDYWRTRFASFYEVGLSRRKKKHDVAVFRLWILLNSWLLRQRLLCKGVYDV